LLGHVIGVPEQVPLLQVSLMVQNSPSSQGAPLLAGIFWQPSAGSQTPWLHGPFKELQFTSVVPMQVPLAHKPLAKHLSFGTVQTEPLLPGADEQAF
jgi:hypothetical protein